MQIGEEIEVVEVRPEPFEIETPEPVEVEAPELVPA